MNENFREGLRANLGKRALQLESELGVNRRIQDQALLARLMDRCLSDEDWEAIALEPRLKKTIDNKRAKPVRGADRQELEEISRTLGLTPGLVNQMWRAHLGNFHTLGRGLEGSGHKARFPAHIGKLELKAIETAASLPEVLEICFKDLSEAHPVSALRVAIEHVEALKTQLDNLDSMVREELAMPAVGRKRHRTTESDEIALEAYYLVYIKKIHSSDSLIWHPFAKDSERERLKDPSVSRTVKNRASKMIQKMAKRIEELDLEKREQAIRDRMKALEHRIRLTRVCRYREMGREGRKSAKADKDADWNTFLEKRMRFESQSPDDLLDS